MLRVLEFERISLRLVIPPNANAFQPFFTKAAASVLRPFCVAGLHHAPRKWNNRTGMVYEEEIPSISLENNK